MEPLKKEQSYILDLVSNYLFQVPIDLSKYEEIDYKYVASKAKEQKLEAILYHAFVNNKIENDYVKYLSGRNAKIFYAATNQEYSYQQIIKVFNDNNIDYVPLKGTYMKHYYPEMEVRMMGDIDILIHQEQRELVKDILSNNGYEYDISNCGHHDICNKGPFGHFEIHFRLLDESGTQKEIVDEMAWDEVSNHNFSIEFNIAYQLAHYAKHFSHGGASFKSMIDIGYMMLKNDIDKDRLKETLIKTEQYAFFNNVIVMFNYFFKQNVFFFENKLTEEEILNLGRFLFKCGDFGFGEENSYEFNRNVYVMSKEKKVTKWSKIKYMIKQVCIPYRVFKDISKVVKYCPILLPFGWVVRFIKYLFTHKGRIKNKLDLINKVSQQDVEDFTLVNKLLGNAGD